MALVGPSARSPVRGAVRRATGATSDDVLRAERLAVLKIIHTGVVQLVGVVSPARAEASLFYSCWLGFVANHWSRRAVEI